MDPARPDVARAAAALHEGKLVAFPTETVYGLGADAENEVAVRRIFQVKGRPANHPLIVHVSASSEITHWARSVPQEAELLAEAFWPGPLTLLLPKSPRVARATTGGLDSVGLRVPAHPIALELLRCFGGGLAAPSANKFGRVSPTLAEHVAREFGSEVEFVLDGGPCEVGVESTIVDLTRDAPALVRPGGITLEQIEAVLGKNIQAVAHAATRAPGLLESHYAPRARVEVVAEAHLAARARERLAAGERVALLVEDAREVASLERAPESGESVIVIALGKGEQAWAQRLYRALRDADDAGATVILAPERSRAGLGAAVADRLAKAGGPRP